MNCRHMTFLIPVHYNEVQVNNIVRLGKIGMEIRPIGKLVFKFNLPRKF